MVRAVQSNSNQQPRTHAGSPRRWRRTPQGEARDVQNDRVAVLLKCLLEGYQSGDLPLKKLLRLTLSVLATAATDQRERDRLLGRLMRGASAFEPPTRGRGPRGFPPSIRRLARDLATLVAKRKDLARSSVKAEERVVEIFASGGVTLTVDQVKEFCRPRPRLPRHRA